MTARIPQKVGDFSVLPISMPPQPAFPQSVVHHLYVRRQSPKIPTPDDARSLFVTNVPVDSTEAHFRALFVSLVGAGKFEGITFNGEQKRMRSSTSAEPGQALRLAAHSKKRKREQAEAEEAQEMEDESTKIMVTWPRLLKESGSTAVVLLADERSVDLVLKAAAKACRSGKHPVWGVGGAVDKAVPGLGASWIREHDRLSYPNPRALQAAVDAFFVAFNDREREAAELAKRLRSEPDEDGFVTVTRGGSRAAPARRDEAEEARRRALEKEERKKAELTDFYRFQHRERRKAEQAELLRKFDEDRKKVAAMREKRGKFRPET